MDSRELFHLWANQSKPSAKCGNVFFEGDTCYSYGKHFPVGKLVTLDSGRNIALLNPDGYSVSTSRHKSYARQAIHGREIYMMDVKAWHDIKTESDLAAHVAIQKILDEENAEKAKQLKREAAKARREEKKYEKINHDEQVELWRAGGRLPLKSYYFPCALRLIEDGKRIQTSKGATIPTIAAKRAWPVILENQNDPLFDWGNYKGLSLYTEGENKFLKVGCHNIPMVEVERMAFELQLSRAGNE